VLLLPPLLLPLALSPPLPLPLRPPVGGPKSREELLQAPASPKAPLTKMPAQTPRNPGLFMLLE
jgi:hypothetical protein